MTIELNHMEKMHLNGLVLAAGLSSRMGQLKPLLPLNGKTLIENTVDSMFSAGVQKIIVVLGYRSAEIELVLRARYPNDRLIIAYNRDYATTDMLASIKIGLRCLPECDAFYLLPGDMPKISPQTYQSIAQEMLSSKKRIVFPTVDGYRKHPPLISYGLLEDILAFCGSGGLRELWKIYPNEIAEFPVDDYGCVIDIDTPAQYRQCIYGKEVASSIPTYRT